MKLANNKWFQHFFFSFKLLPVSCLTIVQIYIDIRLILLEIWRGKWELKLTQAPEKTTPKNQSLIKG